MAKAKKISVVSVHFEMEAQKLRAWQVQSVAQLSEEITKKARLKSVRIEQDSDTSPIFVNDQLAKVGDWIVNFATGVFTVMPHKFFSKVMRAYDPDAPEAEEAVVAAPVKEEVKGNLIVLEESEEETGPYNPADLLVEANPAAPATDEDFVVIIPATEADSDWELKRFVAVTSIVAMFKDVGASKKKRYAHVAEMMEGMDQSQKEAVRDEVNTSLSFRAITVNPTFQAKKEVPKSTQRRPFRDAVIPNISVQERRAYVPS